jgi:hypothetical protein
MASALIRHTPILDESPEDRRVALTQRLPSLSNYLATDVSAWAWHMSIVRDNELWRETDASSWDDYCTRIVGKPLDWCLWIIGGYEALTWRRPGPIPEGEALAAGMVAADRMARAPSNGPARTGRPKKGTTVVPLSKGGNDRVAARIKRDHPEIAAAVERGEYPSMRQAAIAAGIVKPPDALRDAQRAWAKMIPEERNAFEDWIANWRRSHGEVA